MSANSSANSSANASPFTRAPLSLNAGPTILPPSAIGRASPPPPAPAVASAGGSSQPMPAAMAAPADKKKKKRPPGLSLATTTAKPADTFVLTETGTFQKGGFHISASGIAQRPGAASAAERGGVRGDFSALTLGQLEVERELGEGACGRVNLARHKPTGRLLATKVVSNVVGDKGVRHQMLNELRLLCTLDHPCIVPLFDAFFLDGSIQLALGFMDGGSLEDLIREYAKVVAAARLSSGGLPEKPLAHLLLQVLAGLAYLHERGVVHRDLKPANILLDTRGAVRVSDFGISKQLEATFGMARRLASGTA